MREFKSLKSEKLPDGFDAEIHGAEPIVKVEESKERIVLSYTFPGFYLVDDKRSIENSLIDFKQVNLKGAGFLAESGKPLLPSFGRYINIPFDCNYKFTVDKGRPVEFDNIIILPAQEKVTDGPAQKHEFEYDKAIYAKDALYPKEMVEITGPQVIDDYCALLVHVRPFVYNPAKKKLTGYGDITITITLTPKSTGDRAGRGESGPVDNEAFGNLFLNPGRRINERLEVTAERTIIPPILFRGPEFLIIYHDDFKAAAQKLAKWKNHRGLVTEIVAIGSIGNTVAQIKSYIRGRRTGFARLRYVLLIGDVDRITSETVGAAGPWGANISDYYYSTASDPTTNTDCIPAWLSIGRIPVATAAEALSVVDQIIAYEKNPPSDPNYYSKTTLAAFFQEDDSPGSPGYGKDDRGFLKTIEETAVFMTSLGYDVQRVFVSDIPNPQFYYDGTPIPASVLGAIVSESTATGMMIAATTEGRLIIGHRDHGDVPGWVHPPFTVTDLNSVTGDMPTIFYSINCLTGMFDSTSPAISFAEKNLIMKGTAPSIIAATRVSNSWLNNYLIKGLFDAMFGGMLPTFPGGTASYPVKYSRIGDILNYAKSYLPIAMSGDAFYIKDHHEIYHVLGDPTLELWKEQPHIMKICAILTRLGLDIKLLSCPKGTVLTIWYGDKMLKRLEPSSNHITIPLTGLVPVWPPRPPFPPIRTPLTVCFWAPGYHYVELRVEMRPISPIP